MKIPEFLFKIINAVVDLIVKSPVHFLVSDSIMVIHFTGRKSGKALKTPVRYIEQDGVIQCFTSASGKWWRNVRDHPEVSARVKGDFQNYMAKVTTDNTQQISAALARCLELFPQDAVYHDISLDRDGSPNRQDFERALPDVVLIELTRVD